MKAIRNYHETHPGKPTPLYQLCIESVFRLYFPSGRLILSIEDGYGEGYRHRWRDTKHQRVEDCLGSFIEGLITVAEIRKAERLKRENQAQSTNGPQVYPDGNSGPTYGKAEPHLLAIIRTPTESTNAIEALEQFAAKWEKAQSLRRFLAVVEAQNYPKELVGKWLEWAHRYVDSIDPLNGSFKPR